MVFRSEHWYGRVGGILERGLRGYVGCFLNYVFCPENIFTKPRGNRGKGVKKEFEPNIGGEGSGGAGNCINKEKKKERRD